MKEGMNIKVGRKECEGRRNMKEGRKEYRKEGRNMKEGRKEGM
jgi:hypothetical protein